MPRSTTRVTSRPLTRAECGEAGILARLATEDWQAMTAAALASPDHVSSLARWTRKALEGNPSLSLEQAERLGERLRRAHYVRMGKLSAEARRIAREAKAELDQADADEPAA